jgi:hypothetical protein
MPIETSTHTYTHPHTRTHMHTRIHTYAHTNEGNVREQSPTSASPSRNNSPYQPQPIQPSPTNQPTPTSAIPFQSTSPLLSLSHFSTSLRFSLAPMHSRVHPLSLSHTLSLSHVSSSHPRVAYYDNVLPRTRARNRARRSAGARRLTAATLARMIGGKLPSSVPAPANSHPSSANFPSHRRKRLSGNRLLLAI